MNEEVTRHRCVCAHCNKIFETTDGITRHLTEIHTDIAESKFVPYTNEFECLECYLSFFTDFEKRKHMVLIHGQDDQQYEFEVWKSKLMRPRHTCQICHRNYSKKSNLVSHLIVHSNPKYYQVSCKRCGKVFKYKAGLKTHMMYVHKVPREVLYPRRVNGYEDYIEMVAGKKFYKCNQCNYSTDKLQRFQRHHTSHTNPEKNYTCEHCGKEFRLRDNIITHLRKKHRMYSDQKFIDEFSLQKNRLSHRCDLCSKSFSTAHTLKTHIRSHTGERPFACEICDKRFAQSSSLHMHKYSHNKEKQYFCDVCNKSFTYKQGFDRHMRVHAGEKSHTCELCGKSFFDSGSLRRHGFVHTDITPYVCFLCGAAFKMLRYLRAHEATHKKRDE